MKEGRDFNITFTHWQKNSSVWPYKTLLQEYYIYIKLPFTELFDTDTYGVVEEIRVFQS